MTKKVNVEYFDSWTEGSAYLLGFLYADGCLTVKDGKYYSIIFGSSELAYIEKIKEALESDHKINVNTTKHPDGRVSVQYKLVIGQKHMCERLMELGITVAKTRTKTFPDVPKEFLSHFIRGYFDGNGHFTYDAHNGEKKRLVSGFTTGSPEFANGLVQAIASLGLREAPVGYRQKSATSFSDSYYINYYVRDTRLLYEQMYSSATIYMDRKKEYYDDFKNTKKL